MGDTQRVAQRVHHRGHRTGAARLTASLDAERVGGRRHRPAGEADHRQVLGPGQAVIHVAAALRLAFLTVGDPFVQRLADALGNTTLGLALDQQRVHHHAEIIDRGVGDDLGMPGVGVDLDLADVAAIRVGLRRLVEHVPHVQPTGVFRRHLHDAHAPVGAGNREAALAEFDVNQRGLQHVRRQRPGLLHHQRGRLDDGTPGRHQRLRTASAAARDQQVAIGLHQPHALERHPQMGVQHLGEGAPVALAVIQRAGDDGDKTVFLEADLALFLGRRGGAFQEVADADAAQNAAPRRFRPACRKAIEIAFGQRLVEQRTEFAAIIDAARSRLVWHCRGRDVVQPAQLKRVAAEFARGGFDQPLHEVVALGPPGAAIGADRRRVGQHALRVHLDQRRGVVALDVLQEVAGAHQRRHGGQVGAHIGEARQPHRQESAIGIQRQLRDRLMVAAVLVREEAAGPLIGPFHRPAQCAGGMQQRRIFGIGAGLHAEAAADIAGQHAELLVLHPHDAGHLVA